MTLVTHITPRTCFDVYRQLRGRLTDDNHIQRALMMK